MDKDTLLSFKILLTTLHDNYDNLTPIQQQQLKALAYVKSLFDESLLANAYLMETLNNSDDLVTHILKSYHDKLATYDDNRWYLHKDIQQ